MARKKARTTKKRGVKKKASKKAALRKRPGTGTAGADGRETIRLSADDVRDLTDKVDAVAEALGLLRRRHAARLSPSTIVGMRDLQMSVINVAQRLTTMAVGLELDARAVSLDQLHAATEQARDAIDTMDDIKRAVEIATALVSLGGALLMKDIGGVARAAADLYEASTRDRDTVA